MECPPSREKGADSQQRERWLFTYAIDGDLRFLSHHDTLRMFERAIVRAMLPVRYTQGFNPHPKLSNPLPLPVGVASEAEPLVVEFDESVDGDAALCELQRQLPADVQMISVRRVETHEPSGRATVRYRLDASDTPCGDLESCIRRITETSAIPVERVNPKTGSLRVVDVRPYLLHIGVEGNAVEFTLRVTGSGTARPAEIAGLMGFEPTAVNHRIRRLEVQWE